MAQVNFTGKLQNIVQPCSRLPCILDLEFLYLAKPNSKESYLNFDNQERFVL